MKLKTEAKASGISMNRCEAFAAASLASSLATL